MEQNVRQNSQKALVLDWPYLFRLLARSVLVIILSACIVAVGTYVLMDSYLDDTYTASVLLSVVPRDTSTTKQSSSSTLTALTRCLNVLNSDTMEEQVQKNEEVTGISGTISAARVEDTNLIRLSVSDSSAEGVFRLLKAAVEAYPQLSDYFESGYLIRSLTSLSADNIVYSRANPLRYAMMAALLALAAGIGLNVLFALYTDRIHSREQAEQLLDISVIGSLARIKKKRDQKAILVSDELTDPLYLEDMDKLTTRVQDRMDARHFHSLLITSILENEGKSTVSANIALNLAQRGKRVVLIDCDLRKPAMARIFDISMGEHPGLSDLLNGGGTLDDMPMKLKLKGADRLTLILQKKAVADADQLLEGETFAAVLKDLEKTADYVIMDTPPLGIVRDAEIVSKYTDAALITFEQDEIRAVDINDTVDYLEKA
ncbi:MAG: polysaccharide biosynthesis tyrosine autokinase, partial [Lachnospiraceae bacterium]|nr:polysaccharide biosynthesis tyrosine autokinase [Lachnospiraceae bacterium]